MHSAGMLRRRVRGGSSAAVAEDMAANAHMNSAQEVCKQCGVDSHCGLAEEEVGERQSIYGLNVLPSKVGRFSPIPLSSSTPLLSEISTSLSNPAPHAVLSFTPPPPPIASSRVPLY